MYSYIKHGQRDLLTKKTIIYNSFSIALYYFYLFVGRVSRK